MRTSTQPAMVVDKAMLNVKRHSKSEIDANDNGNKRFVVDEKYTNMVRK